MAGGWIVRRAVARRPVLLTLAALVFVTSLVLAGITGYADVARAKAVREYFSAARDADSALVVRARRTEDPAAQQAGADRVFAELYDGLHVRIKRTTEGEGEGVFVRWDISPDPEEVTPGELRDLAAAVAATREAVSDAPGVAPRGVLVSGDLAGSLETVARSLDAAVAVRPVPPLLVAAISLLMLVQLARLLTFERRSETALVRSRGASAGQLARVALAEAAAVSVPAAAAGAVVPHLALRAGGGGVPWVGWVLAAVVALVAVAMVAVPAAVQARLPADRQNIDDSGRGRVLTLGGVVLLVVATAALSTVRFRQEGSGVYVDDSGVLRVDPLAVVAPALLLLAAGVVATLLFGAVAQTLERAAARRPGLASTLAARQVARRTVAFGGAVLMVAIAVGAATVAASYSRTQSEAQDRVDSMRNGATVRVDLLEGDPELPGEYADPAAPVSGLGSVDEVMPAVSVPAEVGDLTGTLTGVTTERLAVVAPDTVVDSLGALPTIGSESDQGWLLPDDTSAVTVELSATGLWEGAGPDAGTLELSATVWVRDPSGVLVAVDAGEVELPMTTDEPAGPRPLPVAARLPGVVPGTRVIGVDLSVPTMVRAASLGFELAGAEAETTAGEVPVEADPDGWTAVSAGDVFSAVPGGATATLHPGMSDVVRLTPSGGPLPIAVDRFLARRFDVDAGDELTLELGTGRAIEAEVTSVSDKLPGEAGTARVFTESTLLAGALLRGTFSVPGTTQLWVAPRDERAVTDIVDALPTAQVRAADARSIDALLVPAGRTLWFGAAGALLLAAVGVGSVVASLGETRRGELVVLRSVGVTARDQARGRRRELFPVLGAGWLLGVLGGVVAVLATVPGLARSALVDAAGDPVRLRFDVGPWMAFVGVHVAVVVVLVLVHADRVRRDVPLATPSEVEP